MREVANVRSTSFRRLTSRFLTRLSLATVLLGGGCIQATPPEDEEVAATAAALTSSLPATIDSTIVSPLTSNSNGSAQRLYVGTGGTTNHRAMMYFDLSGYAQAAITGASLTFTVAKVPMTAPVASSFVIYPLTVGWSEGTTSGGHSGADCVGSGGYGVTWAQRFCNSGAWTPPGGTFVGGYSGFVGTGTGTGGFTINQAQVLTDVQNWANGSVPNGGWIMSMWNEGTTKTGRQIYSRESGAGPSLNLTFTCNNGYTWNGSSCALDFVWCPFVSIGNGGASYAGGLSSGWPTYSSTATYSCNTGYYISGSTSGVCQANKAWSTSAPSCFVDYGYCAYPTVTNGTYALSGGIGVSGWPTYTASASYSCNTGYANSGSASGSCNAAHAWSASANCTAVSAYCPSLPAMSNGSWGTASGGIAGGSTWSLNASDTYTCASGYSGGGVATCQAGGTWSTPTACTVNNAWCAAPTVTNGTVAYTGGLGGNGTRSLSALATYTCSTGYSNSGAASGTCQANTSWSGAPNCTAVVAYCGSLPAMSNGSWGAASGGIAGGSTSSLNAQITYTCGTGYAGGGTATCQAGGSWSTPTACTAVSPWCAASPSNISNGSYVLGAGAGGFTNGYNATATYSCGGGYAIAGSNPSTCQSNQTWSVAPSCNAIASYCGAAPAVTNGSAGSPTGGAAGGGTNSVNATVTYACSGGYAIGGTNPITCQSSGAWTSVPTCSVVANYCGAPPAIANGGLSSVASGAAGGSTNSVGAVATYTCATGYKFSALGTSSCQASGSWTTTPVCIVDVLWCPAAPGVANAGAATLTGGLGGSGTRSYLATATYTCSGGYAGGGASTCQAGQTWSASPSCSAIPDYCGAPAAVTDSASVSVSGGAGGGSTNSVGATATYVCSAGYAFVGGSTSTCQSSGLWSAAPTCAPIANLCGAPPAVAGAAPPTVSGGAAGGSTNSVNATAAYTCSTGYTKAGSDSVCGSGGSWSLAPTCTADPIWCSTAPVVPNAGAPSVASGVAGGSTTSFSAVATYVCDGGYSFGGGNTATCQASHAWSASPTCVVVANYCGVPTAVSNSASVSVAGGAAGGITNSVGATATYVCASGYAFTGGSTSTCQVGGSWSSAPTCAPISSFCGAPPAVANSGSVNVAGGAGGGSTPSLGATATYACSIGYAKSGADSTCQSSGSWSTPPTCGPVSCGAPPSVAFSATPTVNGGNGGGSTPTYGATATYDCVAGYTQSGANSVCQADGTWTAAPVCNDVDECVVTPLICANGTCSNSPAGAYSCTCPMGYVFANGTCEQDNACNAALDNCLPSAVCTPVGAFSWTCSCPSGYTGDGVTSCTDIDECSSAVTNDCDPVHANCTNTVGSYDCGCDAGYVGDGVTSCTAVGNYCGAATTVTNASAPSIAGGAAGGSTNSIGATATYACDAGYAFTGGSTSMCQASATWTAAPSCAPVANYCGAPPVVVDAAAPSVSGGIGGGATNSLSATAAYACSPGYTKSGADPTCQSGGSWSTAPACVAVSNYCGGPPVVPNAGVPSVTGGAAGGASFSLAATAAYTCDAGYAKTGIDASCQADGTWTVPPSCGVIANYCALPPSVLHTPNPTVSGGAAGGATSSVDATASYVCDPGFAFVAGSTSTCQAPGTWSTAPACAAVASYCGAPPTVSDAASPTISGGEGGAATTSLNATAAYTCNPGYAKTGVDSVCQTGGTWSTPPSCSTDPAWCSLAPAVANASTPTVVGGLSGGATPSLNAVATYVCDVGYALTGGATSTCQASRSWSASPTCAAVTSFCGPAAVVTNAGVPSVSGGIAGASTSSLGAVATYVCDPGYELASFATSTCDASGTWTAAPSCVPTSNYCGAAPIVANAGAPSVAGGVAMGSTSSLGATASYVCDSGFDLSGTNPVCGAGATWSAAPTCVPRDCGTPPIVADASAAVVSGGAAGGTTTTFGAVAAYTCNSGYVHTGTDSACQSDASWSAAPSCNDIDECATNNGGCGSLVFFDCANNIGAPPTCSDIDECATNNGGCGSSVFYTCANNVGASPTCGDVDECATNNGGCGSAVLYSCTNNVGGAPTCGDVDECATNNGGCGSATYFTCANNVAAPATCTDIDECATNNGSCGDPTYFTCANNVGGPATCTDIDECATNNGGCGSATFYTCTNNVGAVPTCGDVDECATNNGSCGDPTFFACTNNVAASPTCTDIDECATNNGGCGSTAFYTCTNNTGALPTCADIDECTTNNGGCGDPLSYVCTNQVGAAPVCGDVDNCIGVTCAANATCVDGNGTYTCGCNAGFAGDGLTSCNDVDECMLGTDDCAPIGGACTNTVGSFTCSCAAGFGGTGHICIDVNDCLVANGHCRENSTCVDLLGLPHACECNPGYSAANATDPCVLLCGDAIRGTGEECDDGNATDGDGCASDCEIELGYACYEPVVVDAGVDASVDGSVDGGQSTPTNPSVCTRTCGNAIVDPPYETCDDGPSNSDVVAGACRTTCRIAGCGDGIVDVGEACDDGYGNSDTRSAACRTDCRAAFCGDGVIDLASGEVCDPGGGVEAPASACASPSCHLPDAGVDGGSGHAFHRGDCGCRLAAAPSTTPPWLALGGMLVVALVVAVRRRR